LVKLQPFDLESQLDALRTGLLSTPKRISPYWIYDDNGSALFQQITQLPEYYLSRTEAQLLLQQGHHIAHWLDSSAPNNTTKPLRVIELGAGDGTKASLILSALNALNRPVSYFPVDISAAALEQAAALLSDQHPNLPCVPLLGDFFEGLRYTHTLPAAQQLILFLGSNIGNLEGSAVAPFLQQIAASMQHEDRLLVGFDLLKDHRLLLSAYDDPKGITAAFNQNALLHLNNRFNANFDPNAFRHYAYYDPSQEAMKSYLISTQAQTVDLPGLALTIDFQPYEAIYMEHAQKFTRNCIAADAHAAGLALALELTDQDEFFTEVGFVKV
jgi:L-histidine Nalpha-methyltransferase